MKKILSLLALLMTTVAAMAIDFTDKYSCYESGHQDTPYEKSDAKLTVTDNGDGTYNVTFYEVKGYFNTIVDDFGTMTFANIPGTVDADGFTVIQTPEGGVKGTVTGISAGGPSQANIHVKYLESAAKAYATLNAQTQVFNAVIYYTFGTDEGWSTGGGETGGGETPSTNVKVVEDGYAPNGTAFEFPFTIDWQTQRLVAKIDLTNCEDTYSSSNSAYNPDCIFSIGRSDAAISKWSADGLYIHMYYSSRESMLKPHNRVNGKSQQISLAKGVVTFILDKEGLKYLNGEDEVVLYEASTLTGLYDQAELIFGSKEGFGRSHATYELVEVQPLPTEPVTPPVVEPIDPTVVVDLVEPGYVADGTGFKQTHRIDWTTQKVVASVDLSSCQNVKNDSEAVFVAGSEALDWSYDLFTWFVKTGYLNHNLRGGNGLHTEGVDKTQTVKFELSKNGGYLTNGNVVYAASNGALTPLFEGDKITVGSCSNHQASNATYNYIKIVPLDWTEPVTPPAFEEKTLTKVANAETTFNGKTHEYADVEAQVTEYEEGKYKVVYKQLTVNTAGNDLVIGDVTVDNLTATVEGATTTLATTEATKATLTNLGADFAGMQLVTEGGELTLSDFAASYTLADEQIDKLNIKFYVAPVSMPSIVFGVEYGKEQAPEPEVTEVSNKDYTNTLKLADATTHEQYVSREAATVNLTVYSDNTAKLTFKEVSLGGGEPLNLVFTGAYTENEGTFALTEATGDEVVKEMFDESTVLTANGTVSEDALSFTYTITTADGGFEGSFAPKEEVTLVSDKTYTSNMRIFDTEDESEANLFQSDNAQVNIMKYSDNSYIVTLKNVTLGGQTANLVFEGNEDAGVATSDEETEETEQVVSVIAQASEETEQILGEGTMAWFQWIEKSEDEIQMQFTLMNQNEETGYTYAGEFNYENETPEPPVTEPFSKENFVGDGTKFNWSIPIDWDTQKVVMELDFSTCETGIEHIFGLGVDGTSWNKNLHMYRSSSDQQLQCYWDGADGNGNNNTNKFDETTPTYVEVSKEKGFVVNDETKIAAGRMDALYELTTLTMGTGEGNNVLSHATYKYVKVVDKDWTREPVTGINAVEAQFGADAQFYTVDGVKLSKLQKGLNIVRSADGKVKKVLVK